MKTIYVYLSPESELFITNNTLDACLIAQFTKPYQLIRYLLGEYNINRNALIWNDETKIWQSKKVKQLNLNNITSLFRQILN